MKIRCIANKNNLFWITIGKEYETEEIVNEKYKIINDLGYLGHYDVKMFENILTNTLSKTCDICGREITSKNPAKILKIDIWVADDEIDTFESKDVCLKCRNGISDAIFDAIEEISPQWHENN